MHLANYPCVTAIAIHISRIFKRISEISLLPRLGVGLYNGVDGIKHGLGSYLVRLTRQVRAL